MNTNESGCWLVWVGGCETHLATEDDAVDYADTVRSQGYDDIALEPCPYCVAGRVAG